MLRTSGIPGSLRRNIPKKPIKSGCMGLPSEILWLHSLGAVAMLCIFSTHPQGFTFRRKRLAASPVPRKINSDCETVGDVEVDAPYSRSDLVCAFSEFLILDSIKTQSVVLHLCKARISPVGDGFHRQKVSISRS